MNDRAKQIRRDTIKLMYGHSGSHYGGSLSCVDILIALYDSVLQPDDMFLLSKGHSCWPLYVMLVDKGFNPKIEHHPHYDPANGINMTSGSLGHGLGYGIGVALAKKLKGESGRVFVLMGDGELQEGAFWEGLLILNKLLLDNIVLICDGNSIQGSDFVENVLPAGYLYMPTIAFMDVWAGNDIDVLVESISPPRDRPFFYYCHTIKGKGVSFLESKPEWHSKTMNQEQYEQALNELS